MRIPSGVTDQYIYFVAVDSTDFSTRETGLSGFTVYRSRNGAAAAAMTTPTINETDSTNMPGVYELLLDEDMTIGSGNDSEEMVFHITATGMAPVTRTIELYRPKITAGNTLGVAADGDVSGNVDGSVASVTAAITLPSIPSNWITAAGINASALNGKGDWNIGKTGYSLSQAFPTNFADLAITATTGLVSVTGTVDANLVQMGGVAQSATDLKDFADEGYDPATNKVQGVVLVDTTTTNTDMRGTDGANTTTPPTAAAVADAVWDEATTGHTTAGTFGEQVKTDIDAILVDTGTTLETHLTDIKGATFSGATDSLEAIRDRGDAAWTTGAGGTPPQLLQSTTIATLASQTSFTLTAGSADDDAYNGAIAVITDQTTSTQKAVGTVSDYVGSTKTITLSSDPAIFTMAVGDTIEIIAALGSSSGGLTQQQVRDAMKLAPTAGSPSAGSVDDHLDKIEADTNELQTDDVPGLIAALNDVAATDIVSNGAITTLAGAVVNVDTVDTCTTNTDMRGTDGANTTAPPTAGAIADAVCDEVLSGHVVAGSLGKAIADIESDATAILADTADMQPKLGTPSTNISADIAAVKADTAAILIDTNELQGDWTNGGRLDLILDAILDDTGTAGVVLTSAERNAIADAILDRDMATGTDSGSASVRTVRQALRFNRNKVSISGGTLTVTKEDDTTASWTATITTAAGDPINSVDPAS